jgi:hypothetical protein
MSDSNKQNNDYSSISLTRMQMNLSSNDRKVANSSVNWLDKKFGKIKKACKEFWVVGKTGFMFGGLVGCCLGLVFGGYESIRQRSIWPLPLAMLGSGFSFACIFGVSTLIRLEKDSNKTFHFEIVVLDPKTNKYERKEINYFERIPKI